MNYHQIGQRIRAERLKFNLTQEKFAEAIGMSAMYIGQVERGERKMSLDTLIKVSDCLHVSTDYLIRGAATSGEVTSELQSLLDRCSPGEISVINDVIKVILPHIKAN